MKQTRILQLIVALLLSTTAIAQNQTSGEYPTQLDGTPATVGQATNDHLFTRCEYEGETYTNKVSFKNGSPQVVWFHLDDDEIYLNEAIQALTPIAYNSAGDLYHEITYNSFQCDIYLPEYIELISVENEDGDEIKYLQGDRLPNSSNILWSERDTTVIDQQTYRVYTVTCINVNSYGSHLSARNASRYKQYGALKKDATLFALHLRNNNQDTPQARLGQDMIIANQLLTLRETYIADWNTNEALFFYGTGGNNKSQRFMKYNRVELYGSKGIKEEEDPYMMGDANNSSTVTITDAVATARYLQGLEPDPFVLGAADIDRDGDITATDATLIADQVLTSTDNDVTAAAQPVDDRFYIEDITINGGETQMLSIQLDNAQQYTAFQMDIKLPAGLTVEHEGDDYYFDLTSRKGRDHTIESHMRPDGTIRVVAYSLGVKPISGTNGSLVTFNVIADNGFKGAATIEMKNILFTTADGEEFLMADEVCHVNGTGGDIIITGDVDGNGAVNIDDVTTLINHLLKQTPVDGDPDVDDSGKANIDDVTTLINMLLHKEH